MRGALLFLMMWPAVARGQACEDAAPRTWTVVVEGVETAPRGDVPSAIARALGATAPQATGDAFALPGTSVKATDLAKIESSVLETGWFEWASAVLVAKADGCVLRVRVGEFAPVTAIEFEKMRAYDGGKELLPLIETKVGTRPNLNVIAKDGARIVGRFHEDGYEAARLVRAEVDAGAVVFRVAEGRIARIEVAGAHRTGAKRVRKILGIKKGDLYDANAIVKGQGALYRTNLFGLVGFGIEPLEDDDLVLTVTVGELTNPYSRTDVFVDRGFTATSIEARIRNVRAGHSSHARVDVLGPAPDSLAEVGFDEFYALQSTVDLRLFRYDPTGPGARLTAAFDRVHRRRREDLDLTYDVDLPSLRASVDLPVTTDPTVVGTGVVTAEGGWRLLESDVDDESRPWGRGEVGFDVQQAVGLETPASLAVRSGVEMNSGARPFAYLSATARWRWDFSRGQRLDLRGDATTITGRSVPYWREVAVGGLRGPIGYGRDIGFGRHIANGSVAYVASLPRELFGVSVGWQGAAWSGANGARGTDGAHSGVVALRAGPEFARITGGVALPLKGTERDADPWWFATLTIATPY